jgi:hypothetical protein
MSANKYLDRLKAEADQTCLPDQPSKHSKGGFEGFEGDPPRHISKNHRALAKLRQRCPRHIREADWRQAIADGETFLARWGDQAEKLGWQADDLFELPPVPTTPHPSYERLARLDQSGLIWLLRGREVVALTDASATIRTLSGTSLTYRKRSPT